MEINGVEVPDNMGAAVAFFGWEVHGVAERLGVPAAEVRRACLSGRPAEAWRARWEDLCRAEVRAIRGELAARWLLHGPRGFGAA